MHNSRYTKKILLKNLVLIYKYLIIFIFSILISSIIHVDLAIAFIDDTAITPQPIQTQNKDNGTLQIENPFDKLQIKIPGMARFSEAKLCQDNSNKLCVNWIAEYIAGIYKYAIGIVGILATVVMMIGGVMWMMSGGNASTAGEAKSWITASLTGLIIALSSYMILYQVNPSLVIWDPLKLPVVKEFKISEDVLNYTGFTSGGGVSGPLSYNSAEWDSLIGETADRYGVDSTLLKAIMATESAGKKDAISPKGAQGLMQLMPKTASWLGVTDPLDPAQNLAGGATYIRDLLKNYNGDRIMALAAYNWGPGNLQRNGINSMPLETRNYISRVTGYYDIFKR